MNRQHTRYPGVYERESLKRGLNGKHDVCFDITYKINGKKIWEKIGWLSEGYSAKLASQVRAERIRSIRHSDELPHKKPRIPLFKEVAKKYLEWASENKTRSGRDDEYRYRRYLAPALDNKRLDHIYSFTLERLKSDLLKKDLSPASVKHCLVLVRQVINKATIWGMYNGNNPVTGVKLPVLQNQRERYLNYEEAGQLLAEVYKISKITHDMALLSLHCGLRAGEIFNIKGQDLDFENSLIHISDPKNTESRKAFMTESVKSMLLERNPEEPNQYIFTDREHDGKIQRISNSFMKTVNKLGLNTGITDRRQRITFHSLRHTFASWLALQGETILTIKDLLGHKTLAMTARYAHLSPDQKKRATMNLEENFNAANMDYLTGKSALKRE